MEFEDNRPTSDADRRLAEAKKLTLQPVHADITPDAPNDSEIAARHVNSPAIANVATDTEDNSSQVQPTQSFLNTQPTTPASIKKPVLGIVLGTLLFASLAAFALLK